MKENGLWSDIAIQQFLTLYYGKDVLGPSGIDGILGAPGSGTYSRTAIDRLNEEAGLSKDGGVWGTGCQTYAEKKLDDGFQFSEHFKSNEFGCGIAVGDDDSPSVHDSDCHHWPDMMNTKLIELLETFRSLCSKYAGQDCPVQITSGVRCLTYNSSLSGSSSESRHMCGRAVDCNTYGMISYDNMVDIAKEAGFTYCYAGNGFAHLQYDGGSY